MQLFNLLKKTRQTEEIEQEQDTNKTKNRQISYTFTDADRARSELQRRINAMKSARMKALNDRIAELEARRQEKELMDQIAQLEDDLSEEEIDESEETESEDDNITNQILKSFLTGMNKKVSPQTKSTQLWGIPQSQDFSHEYSNSQASPPSLLDLNRLDEAQCREITDQIPKKLKELIKSTDPNTLMRVVEIVQNEGQ